MPIRLDAIEKNAKPVNSFSPKFFSKKLTGRGGNTTTGVLSQKNAPINIEPDETTLASHSKVRNRSYKNGYTTVTQIPLNPICYNAAGHINNIKRPPISDMAQIGSAVSGQKNLDLYMKMELQAILFEDTVVPANMYVAGGNPGSQHHTILNYVVTFFSVADDKDEDHARAMHTYGGLSGVNTFWTKYTSNPMADFADFSVELNNDGWKVDMKAITDYLTNFDCYDAASHRSEEWQSTIAQSIDTLFVNLKGNSNAIRVATEQLRYIMSYKIPLNLYKDIYASVSKNFSADDAHYLCKQNLNLLLSDTMQHLESQKPSITCLPAGVTPTNLPKAVTGLSKEQQDAACTNEPLTLVQAGAGTGKSTLILGRIEYLRACGIKPEDIMVLSFTNAAADHIIEKSTGVHAMTIARMINEIYQANFNDHELSSIDTLINSLKIYFPKETDQTGTVQNNFYHRLRRLAANDENGFTDMNNFIEAHYDDVISMLNKMKQTSLELEIIICYQKIDSFIEPSSVASKFLIIDEVQDNSIFEFVYTLKYIDKHKEPLFIVGDGSQTLFEFRASNPRALNILEGSGVFKTYQLNINYRSNQEILDFANIALQNIEANQYANIQLRANSLRPITEQSFMDAVHFNYVRLRKIGDFYDSLGSVFARDLHNYIQDCFARKESVAILSYTRADIAKIRTTLEHMYPNAKIASLVPKKTYNTTTFSSFISKFWNEINFMPYTAVTNIISREIMSRLDRITYSGAKAADPTRHMLADWVKKDGATIQSWAIQAQNGQMSHDDFVANVKEDMLQYEIRTNAIKQTLTSSQNNNEKEAAKEAGADFLLSTIHSAKGLEFDNVIVFYRNENTLDEDKKRMYYVSFTRAMKTEYIVAYDTVASPQIEADYVTVLKKLHDIAPSPASPFNKQAKNNWIKI